MTLCFLWAADNARYTFLALSLNVVLLAGWVVNFSLRARARSRCPTTSCALCEKAYGTGPGEVFTFLGMIMFIVLVDLYLLWASYDIYGVFLASSVDLVFVVSWTLGFYDRTASRTDARGGSYAELFDRDVERQTRTQRSRPRATTSHHV